MMNGEERYGADNVETGSPPRLHNESKRKKNRAVAVMLGLIFGPFGTLYFGRAVFVTTMINVIVVSLLVALLSPFDMPKWYGFIFSLFYGFWGFVLASVHNEVVEEDEPMSLAGLNLISMNGWLVRVMLWTTGLYSMAMLFSEGRWILAILTPILFIPLITLCVEQVITFLTAVVAGIFA